MAAPRGLEMSRVVAKLVTRETPGQGEGGGEEGPSGRSGAHSRVKRTVRGQGSGAAPGRRRPPEQTRTEEGLRAPWGAEGRGGEGGAAPSKHRREENPAHLELRAQRENLPRCRRHKHLRRRAGLEEPGPADSGSQRCERASRGARGDTSQELRPHKGARDTRKRARHTVTSTGHALTTRSR